jgi:hypothetical protein
MWKPLSLRIHDSECGNQLLIVIIHANYLTEINTFYNFARFVAPVSSRSNEIENNEPAGSSI